MTQRVHVVMIDDNIRFALHLARCFGLPLRAGIGNMSDKQGNPFQTGEDETKTVAPLISENGLVFFWWVCAKDRTWKSDLAKVLEGGSWDGRALDVRTEPCVFVIDVRGKNAAGALDLESYSQFGGEPENADKYKPYNVIQYLAEHKTNFTKEDIFIVSSYEVGSIPLNHVPLYRHANPREVIGSKSPESFNLILKRVKAKLKQQIAPLPKEEPRDCHILVTGAGFEIREAEKFSKPIKVGPDLGDGAPPGDKTGDTGGDGDANPNQNLPFGLPSSWHLLKEMADPFETDHFEELHYASHQDFAANKNGTPDLSLPMMRRNPFKSDAPLLREPQFVALQKAARDGNLDAWWDQVLENYPDSMIDIGSESNHDRLKKKENVSELEYKARNAFRNVILNYDTGFMAHSVRAALLPWRAWLTTNYTHFADRAINLCNHLGKLAPFLEEKAPPTGAGVAEDSDLCLAFETYPQVRNWKAIRNSTEAHELIRLYLHGSLSGKPGQETDENATQYLFKLHGDIDRIHTMAIAGHDKEIFTPLSLPVDSLHQIYVAAQAHLDQFANQAHDAESPPQYLVWHIVGHDLKDKLLCKLIGDVSNKWIKHANRRVAVLLINPSSKMRAKKISDLLSFEKEDEILIHRVNLRASEYLARLYLYGFPKQCDQALIKRWLDDLRRPDRHLLTLRDGEPAADDEPKSP